MKILNTSCSKIYFSSILLPVPFLRLKKNQYFKRFNIIDIKYFIESILLLNIKKNIYFCSKSLITTRKDYFTKIVFLNFKMNMFL